MVKVCKTKLISPSINLIDKAKLLIGIEPVIKRKN